MFFQVMSVNFLPNNSQISLVHSHWEATFLHTLLYPTTVSNETHATSAVLLYQFDPITKHSRLHTGVFGYQHTLLSFWSEPLHLIVKHLSHGCRKWGQRAYFKWPNKAWIELLYRSDGSFLLKKTFPVVFWCAESEYEHENHRKGVFVRQTPLY